MASWLVLLAVCGWQLYRTVAGEPTVRLRDGWHQGARIVDRHGLPLRELPSELGVRGRSLPLEQLGSRLVAATLISEDKRFFEHGGVDLVAIVRALGQNARHVRRVSGASTITQQLVKLLDGRGRLGPRTVPVKLRETARAQNLEQQLSKRAILEAYLNRLNYGRGLVGPDAAARHYFGVAPQQLSWAQAAFLAVLPRAPSYLDPYRHPERVRGRQQQLLRALRERGLLEEADFERARSEPVVLRRTRHPFLAPHFVEAVRAQHPLEPGARVTTTLDLALQQDAEGLVQTHLDGLRRRGAGNAAVMVIDNPSGEVLAYVGGGDFFDDRASGQVDMVRARRQPGSTLKPFIYALAFASGHEAAELVADVPTRFGTPSRSYAPGNFDGVFRGPVSAREALAGSLNVPAVRLAAELPRSALLDLLHEAGVRSLGRDPDRYGLSLALGSGEVSLYELGAAYAMLARGGRVVALRSAVADRAELGAPADGAQILDPSAVALVTESLSDPLARIRGLGSRGPFELSFPVAVKTGTSSGYRDAWCVGYTRERTVAAWVGNADGRPTAELTGGAAAGPLLADVLLRSMRDVGVRASLWDAELLERVEVCPLAGKPAGAACPHAVTRHVHPRARASAERCELHRFAEPHPTASSGDPPRRCVPESAHRIVVLPDDFADWLERQPSGAPGRDADGLPWFSQAAVEGCGEQASTVLALRIDEPEPGSVLVLSSGTEAEAHHIELRASLVDARGRRAVQEAEFVLDGVVVARSRWPFRASIPAERGDHLLTVRPADARQAVRPAISRFSVR